MSSEHTTDADKSAKTAAPPTQSLHASDLRAPSEVRAPSQPDTSTRFGPYELLREIGRGGMGTVWLAGQEGQSLFTQIGQVLGTYQYVSPEQANLSEH